MESRQQQLRQETGAITDRIVRRFGDNPMARRAGFDGESWHECHPSSMERLPGGWKAMLPPGGSR